MTTHASTPKVIERRRSPRVQITYDVEFLSGSRAIELPFVMGVMADLAGESQSQEARKPVGERDFVDVDAVSFGGVMEKLAPRVKLRVPDRLLRQQSVPPKAELEVDLTFRSMNDFAPDRIAEQVPALADLLRVRRQLLDLLLSPEDKLNGRDQFGSRFESQRPQEHLTAVAGTVRSEEPEDDFCSVEEDPSSDAF